MRRPLANLCACAAVAATAAGCGGGERRDASVSGETYTVALTRVSFPREQRLAQRSPFVVAVRNAGRRAIPNLVVTLRGFTERPGGIRDADPRRDLWIVDREPAGAATALSDTWAAGRLEPGRTATLRWEVTPVVPGEHELDYEIAPAIAGRARARLANGREPHGSLTVRVTDKPPKASVDPRTGRVLRAE